jgi:hypothetical protein
MTDTSLAPEIVTNPPLYKFLRADMNSPTGSGTWRKNRWRSVRGVLVPCENGLHCTTTANMTPWINETLWRVEIGDEFVEHGEPGTRDHKLVARRMRVVERIEAWNERTARLFAADCAERVLKHFEDRYPEDTRPRDALEVARRYANGEATPEELSAADGAASRASGAAAWAASSAASGAAAWAASSAAWAADRAAWGADWEEREWQNRHLADMLGLTSGAGAGEVVS